MSNPNKNKGIWAAKTFTSGQGNTVCRDFPKLRGQLEPKKGMLLLQDSDPERTGERFIIRLNHEVHLCLFDGFEKIEERELHVQSTQSKSLATNPILGNFSKVARWPDPGTKKDRLRGSPGKSVRKEISLLLE
jgi:hypothetical protein